MFSGNSRLYCMFDLKSASRSSKRHGTCLAVVFIVSLYGCSGDKRKNFELVTRSFVSHANLNAKRWCFIVRDTMEVNPKLSLIQLDKSWLLPIFEVLRSLSWHVRAVIEWIILLAAVRRCARHDMANFQTDRLWPPFFASDMSRQRLVDSSLCWLDELFPHAGRQTILACQKL